MDYGSNYYFCKDCNNGVGYLELHELQHHRRTWHGYISCPFPHDPHRGLPKIDWRPKHRAHMQQCPHPNPCNDFDETAKNIKRCPVCDVELRQGKILDHFRDLHPCVDCEHYIAEYHKFRKLHIRDAHTPAWQVPPQPQPRPQPQERPKRIPKSRMKGKMPKPPAPAQSQGPMDIYSILRISPHTSSSKELERAVRRRRIETHPDKLKRGDMSSSEKEAIDELAKMVGYAADIILDLAKSWEYDLERLKRSGSG